ncbi:MAG: preprotein translocase subunit SecA [Kistimonas sp.]|nr:preprotein translocase subunit SecA [Kistimonas sp.]
MFASLVKKVIGSRNDRQLERMRKRARLIGQLESDLQSLDEDALKARSLQLRERAGQGEPLDDLLVEAFALCREASRRIMGMRHFDVQLIGGMVLHEGRIAEMRTGEGKTLMATLAAYLNALPGRGVHVVTVNEYLACRDARWMQPLYESLGLTVAVVVSQQSAAEKRAAYQADITYGTNNEFGFDYLRDNMAFRQQDRVQRGLNFAIADEVDSILIDEARTPLVISGPAESSSQLYRVMDGLAPSLVRQPILSDAEQEEGVEETGHYTVDEKTRQVELTELGHQFIEEMLTKEGHLSEGESLYAPHNLNLLHHAQAALKAHVLFHRNVEYIVSDQEILLVDEHTGRTMPGRRLSEGLHQALEAKEKLPVQPESQTLASTTFQNYFRLYDKLSGMTGTADTEAYEFRNIYGLDVVVVPTHKPMVREDRNDLVYLTLQEKYEAIIEDIKETVAAGRPVLVGTVSIDSSEALSAALSSAGIEHQVLNAKFHEKEAEIIAQAGRPGAVTIATNMAGRGTDIILGGNWSLEGDKLEDPDAVEKLRLEWQEAHDKVLAAGGLHIIGTERHESRRIDNQLRGRAGRQGDPGSSRFYLSLEDDLMRIFASDRVKTFMQALGMEQGEAVEHRMVTKAIERAQRKVEGRNFDIRRNLLEYDDVANEQRKLVYAQRAELLVKESVKDSVDAMLAEVLQDIVDTCIPPRSLEEQWDVAGLEKALVSELDAQLPLQKWLDEEHDLAEEDLRGRIMESVQSAWREREELVGAEAMRGFEKHILLRILDEKWKDHLATMDYLRQSIHLRGYAARNPKQEYKREAFDLFSRMLAEIRHELIRVLSHIHIEGVDAEEARDRVPAPQKLTLHHAKVDEADASAAGDGRGPAAPLVRSGRKVGRNEACPCGSGRKFKQCHGKLAD